MKEDNQQKKFVCKCGKEFQKINGMTGHQANCKVHKQKIQQEKEARRLPNGMFKCENPKCEKEHDGNYGSGRFCSKHCYKQFVSLRSVNHRKIVKVERKASRSPYGTWKCNYCGLIFDTRSQLKMHFKDNPTHRGPNLKGKNKNNCESIRKAALTLKQRYKTGELIPSFKGKHHSLESRQKMSNTMKLAHKEGRANNFAKSRHSCEGLMSYPEKWFLGVIKNEFSDQNFTREYPFFKYSLDFAWIDKKKCIEIDGAQHYDGRFPERIQHDIERDIYLKANGWKVLRLRWKYVYKQKKYWIKIAKRFIDDNLDF